MVGFISVTVDISPILRDIDFKLQKLDQTKRDILYEIGTEAVNEMRHRVHVITGRTRDSTKISQSFSPDFITVTSTYGAVFEEARGDPHDFMTQTADVMNEKIPTIIRNGLNKNSI